MEKQAIEIVKIFHKLVDDSRMDLIPTYHMTNTETGLSFHIAMAGRVFKHTIPIEFNIDKNGDPELVDVAIRLVMIAKQLNRLMYGFEHYDVMKKYVSYEVTVRQRPNKPRQYTLRVNSQRKVKTSAKIAEGLLNSDFLKIKQTTSDCQVSFSEYDYTHYLHMDEDALSELLMEYEIPTSLNLNEHPDYSVWAYH